MSEDKQEVKRLSGFGGSVRPVPKTIKESTEGELKKKVKQADSRLSGKVTKTKDSNSLDVDAVIDIDKVLADPEIELVSVEQLKKIYPIKVNQEVLTRCTEVLNEAISNTETYMQESLRDNLINYIDVLKGENNTVGRNVNFKDYVKAVKFAMYKMAGNTDVRAYSLAFPERVSRMQAEGLPNTHLYAYAGSYARSKLVTDVISKMMIPTHILYHDIFGLAVKTQVEIMTDDKVSPKVRSDAANSLMTHLKQPEIKKAELDISIKETDAISQLREALDSLSAQQQSKVIEGEYDLIDVSESVIYTKEEELADND